MAGTLDLIETGLRFFNNALRCVALRCVALRCVALRCVAESFCLQIKSSKKRNILVRYAGKASFQLFLHKREIRGNVGCFFDYQKDFAVKFYEVETVFEI